MIDIKMALVNEANDQLNDLIKDMDQKLNKVLKR